MGRVTLRGTKTAQSYLGEFHCAETNKGQLYSGDPELEVAVEGSKDNDVVIIGANHFNVYGNTAVMVGAPLGVKPGRIISGLILKMLNVIIAVDLDKSVLGSIREIVLKAGC